MKMKALRALNIVALVLASTTFGVASAADEKATSLKTESSEFAELKALLAQQQQQIEQLRKTLEEQQKLLEATIKIQASSVSTDRARPLDVGQVASTSPFIPLGTPLKPAAIPPA